MADKLLGKVVFITGGSRGIGEAIAKELARQGASVSIAAKTEKEDPRLGGTIHSVVKQINDSGGRAIANKCDIRDEEQVIAAIQNTISIFGGIDILINNASAIWLANTSAMEMKRFDLVHDINVRGTFMVGKYCIPFLKKASNPHIVTLSPPIDLNPKWFAPFLPYTLSKYNMSMMTLGWAEELKQDGIAVNSLWPVTTIATAAVKNLLGGEEMVKRSRHPQILADAVSAILKRNAREFTGHLLLDEDVLKQEGVTDFEKYAVTPGATLHKDLYIS